MTPCSFLNIVLFWIDNCIVAPLWNACSDHFFIFVFVLICLFLAFVHVKSFESTNQQQQQIYRLIMKYKKKRNVEIASQNQQIYILAYITCIRYVWYSHWIEQLHRNLGNRILLYLVINKYKVHHWTSIHIIFVLGIFRWRSWLFVFLQIFSGHFRFDTVPFFWLSCFLFVC